MAKTLTKVDDKIPTSILLVVAAMSGFIPIGIDIYLPTLPKMQEDLSTSETFVQLTLTSFLLGIALGQLFFGTVSDKYGRLKPLIIGSILSLVASIIAVFAPNVFLLIVVRFFQGFGGSAGVVIGRAIVADISSGIVLERTFSLLMVINGVAPIVGPILGSTLAVPLGWRGLLALVLAGAAIILFLIIIFLPETNLPNKDNIKIDESKERKKLLKNRSFVLYVLSYSFAFCCLISYVSASSFIIQEKMGFSELIYGFIFATFSLTLMITSVISAKLLNYFSPRILLRAGLNILLIAGIIFGIFSIIEIKPVLFLIPLGMLVGSFGFIFGNNTSLAMEQAGKTGGFASAILGSSQFIFGAIAAPLVSLKGATNATPLAIVILVCVGVSLILFKLAKEKNGEINANI